MRALVLVGCLVAGARARRASGESVGDPPALLIVSGLSSDPELCLAVESGAVRADGAALVLENCAAAVAAGDGRELWKLQPGGALIHAVSQKCAVVGNATDQGHVELKACDGAPPTAWAELPNGQLRIGQQCLSQSGNSPGVTDVAAGSAASATSTLSLAHGPGFAVDGLTSTYWASAFDVQGPVVLSADLGVLAVLLEAVVAWEFPARAFSVALQQGAEHWKEVFATDTNILHVSRLQLGGRSATAVRLTMTAMLHSSITDGPGVYGVRSLRVLAGDMRAVVRDCSEASRSVDARDKYFPVRIREFDPKALDAVRAELPALAEAESALSAVVSEINSKMPTLVACIARSNASYVSSSSEMVWPRSGGAGFRRGSGDARRSATRGNGVGVDGASVQDTLAEARRAILEARGMLV